MFVLTFTLICCWAPVFLCCCVIIVVCAGLGCPMCEMKGVGWDCVIENCWFCKELFPDPEPYLHEAVEGWFWSVAGVWNGEYDFWIEIPVICELAEGCKYTGFVCWIIFCC